MNKRLTWGEYALGLAIAAMARSEDPWYKVGACALRHDHSTAATGYNGAPPGVAIDWSDRNKRRESVIHAERNCLNYVQPGECSLLATTCIPCGECLAEIKLKRIPQVVYRDLYLTDPSLNEKWIAKAKSFGIELIHLPDFPVK